MEKESWVVLYLINMTLEIDFSKIGQDERYSPDRWFQNILPSLEKKVGLDNKELKILVAVVRSLPMDAAVESLSIFDPQIKVGKRKERALALLTITTLTNLIDAFFENKENANLVNDIRDIIKDEGLNGIYSIMIVTEDGETYSLGEILDSIESWIFAHVSQRLEFKKKILEIFAVQTTFTAQIEERSVEEAIFYRRHTLGKYYSLIGKISGDKDLLQWSATNQLEDDIADMQEDWDAQIQPFVSLAKTFNLNCKVAQSCFRRLELVGVDLIKEIVIFFETEKTFDVDRIASQSLPANKDRLEIFEKVIETLTQEGIQPENINQLLQTTAKIFDFYKNSLMQP